MTAAASAAAPLPELARLDSDEELEAALARLSPEETLQAVLATRGLEERTRLLWAMEDARRREVVEQLPSPLLAALIQNLEEDNRYLLGDVSVSAFRRLLQLCSPSRQYGWLQTALSFTDARANLLPLLLPTRELAELLLTRPAFERHVRALADYPLEEQRLPPELLLNPAQALVDLHSGELLVRFPVDDPPLARLLQLILDTDPDRYADLLREALALLDYRENHPEEALDLTQAPVLVPEEALDTEPESPVAGPGEPAPSPAGDSPPGLVPLDGAPLEVLLASASGPERAAREAEFEALCIRQAVAEGGSFLTRDLNRIARRVAAYVLLGGDGPLSLAQRLRRGERRVEGLRQIALRLRPIVDILPSRSRRLVAALHPPVLDLDSSGRPCLQLPPDPGGEECVSLTDCRAGLEEARAWVALARHLGLDRTRAALTRSGGAEALIARIGQAAVLYGRVDPDLFEPADRIRFRSYVRARALLPQAEAALDRALEQAGPVLEPQAVRSLLLAALRRTAAEEEA